jgi:tRNA(fMet)-specific endonuclease VapC
MTYLLDTNILVLMVRGLRIYTNPNENQRKRQAMASRILSRAQQQQQLGNRVALSAITVAELEFGAWNSEDAGKETAATRRMMTPFTLLPFDSQACASQYSRIRYALESVGKGIGSLDTLIAAHALALEAILVTTDSGEFCRVPGLKCENWAG